MSQTRVIWWLLLQGVLVAVLMSALWSRTTSVGGKRHSVGASV
jgi:riboflavin transporter 2